MNNLLKAIKVGIQFIKNENFRRWIEQYNYPTSIIFQQLGTKCYGNIVYFIGMKDLGGIENTMGFFALFNCVLNRLYYADRLGLLPIVQYPNTILYYDKERGENPWEYYFEPVSSVKMVDAMKAYNVVISQEKDSQFNLRNRTGYELDDEGISNLAYICNKYIHFNDKTKTLLTKDMLDFPKYEKILGVHVRGTDFNNTNKNHPVVISLEEYINKVKELFENGNYTHIFLATDEKKTVEKMEQIFGNKIMIYDDVLRSDNNLPVHKSINSRKNHKYLLGYEVLRDMLTLSECDGFIAGKSQVSLSVRIFKKAKGKEFCNLCILDNGMYR